MDGITPTMDITRNDGFGGSSGIWLFAILALMFNGGIGNRGNYATTEDLATQSNFSRLENQLGNIGTNLERKADGIVNGISSLGYEMAQQFGNTNTRMATGFCDTSKQILESRYLNSQEINAAKSEILGALSQNKIDALQAKINELQLAQATGNVVRYPSGWTYNAGTSPFCNCNQNYATI